jgi:hypothetical protein
MNYLLNRTPEIRKIVREIDTFPECAGTGQAEILDLSWMNDSDYTCIRRGDQLKFDLAERHNLKNHSVTQDYSLSKALSDREGQFLHMSFDHAYFILGAMQRDAVVWEVCNANYTKRFYLPDSQFVFWRSGTHDFMCLKYTYVTLNPTCSVEHYQMTESGPVLRRKWLYELPEKSWLNLASISSCGSRYLIATMSDPDRNLGSKSTNDLEIVTNLTGLGAEPGMDRRYTIRITDGDQLDGSAYSPDGKHLVAFVSVAAKQPDTVLGRFFRKYIHRSTANDICEEIRYYDLAGGNFQVLARQFINRDDPKIEIYTPQQIDWISGTHSIVWVAGLKLYRLDIQH